MEIPYSVPTENQILLFLDSDEMRSEFKKKLEKIYKPKAKKAILTDFQQKMIDVLVSKLECPSCRVVLTIIEDEDIVTCSKCNRLFWIEVDRTNTPNTILDVANQVLNAIIVMSDVSKDDYLSSRNWIMNLKKHGSIPRSIKHSLKDS